MSKAFKSLDSDIVRYMALDNGTFWRVLIATILGLAASFTTMKNVEVSGFVWLDLVLLLCSDIFAVGRAVVPWMIWRPSLVRCFSGGMRALCSNC